MSAKLVNLALYQTGWFCCVLGAANGRPLLGAAMALALLAVHVALVTDRAGEIGLLLLAGWVGGVADSLQGCAGLLEFKGKLFESCLAPPWIVVMWMQFASLFRSNLAFLQGRYLLGSALGAVGGPFAFWIGSRLGAVEFAEPTWHSLIALAGVWSVVLPTLVFLAARGDRLNRERRDGIF